MRTVVQFIVGVWIGRIAFVVAVIVAGLLIGHGSTEPAPVAARRAQLQERQEAIHVQAYEEEARVAQFRRDHLPAFEPYQPSEYSE